MVEITGSGTITSDDGSFDGTFTYNAEGAMSAAVGFVETYAQMKAMPTAELVNGQRIAVTTTSRAGDFTVLLGDFSAEVANDTEQGLWVPFDEDSDGSTLVARRDHGREINLDWFGGEGDYDGTPANATDNWDAIMGALGVLSEQPSGASSFIKPSKKLIINDGSYYFSKSIPLRRAVHIEGAGAGLLHFRTTSCFFPPDKHGFIFLGRDIEWDDDTETLFIPESDRDGSAQGATISGMSIHCTDSASATRGVGDGIHLTISPILRDLHISGFGGDGIGAFANFQSSDPATRGNINNFYFDNILIQTCENGISVRGSNSNAGLGSRIDVRGCRQWGILDWSFLGNTWIAPHESVCGHSASITNMTNDGDDLLITTDTDHQLAVDDDITLSEYEGARNIDYGLYTVAEVVSTTQFKLAGRNVDAGTPYVSGGVVGYGGPYATRNINAHSIFVGAYAEGSEGPCFFTDSTFVYGGLIFSGVVGGFFHKPGANYQDPISISEPQSDITVTMGHTKDEVAFRMSGPGQNIFGTQIKWFDQLSDGGTWWFINGNGNNRMLGFTTDSSGFTFGRDSAVVGVPVVGSLWMGHFGNDARCMTIGDAAPTSGEWAQGDIVYNREPTPGGKAGWICTTGGVAGVDAVFKPFGAIDA